MIKTESILLSLEKAATESKGETLEIIVSYILRIVKKSQAAFDYMSGRILFWNKMRLGIREHFEGTKKPLGRPTLRINGAAAEGGSSTQTEVQKNMIDKRMLQIRLIQDRKKSDLEETIVFESDEEVDTGVQGDTVDLRDKDDCWKQVYQKRSFQNIVEYIKTGQDGSKAQDYLMNSEDRVAPAGTATIEYGFVRAKP